MLPRLATSATLAVMAGAGDVILFCSFTFRVPEYERASHAFILNESKFAQHATSPTR